MQYVCGVVRYKYMYKVYYVKLVFSWKSIMLFRLTKLDQLFNIYWSTIRTHAEIIVSSKQSHIHSLECYNFWNICLCNLISCKTPFSMQDIRSLKWKANILKDVTNLFISLHFEEIIAVCINEWISHYSVPHNDDLFSTPQQCK